MDKQVLLSLLHQPEFLKDELLEELNEIIQKHPYFAIPHILLAKNLHDQNSSLAPQKIRRAALYAYNRSILKKFIMEKPTRINAEEEANFVSPEGIYRNPFGEIQEELEAFDKKMETLTPEDLDKELASITESYIPKEYSLENSEYESSIEFELTENQKEQNSLIDEFLKANSFTATPELNEITSSEMDSEEYAISLFEKGDVQGAISVYERLKLQNPEKESYYQSQINIFSMSLDDIVTDETLIDTNEPTQIDLHIDTDSLLQEILNAPKIEQPTINEKVGETYQTPQESFTTEVHQVEMQEQTPQSFESSENSTISDDEVSEAKALAYFNEGNTAKAIEIYRKLMLQIPEKKAYFASQIEILES